MDKDSPALNARQQLFCDAVLDGCTQAEAYRRAGYQSQQPASGASVLMRRPEVAAYLQQQRRVLEAATPFTRQRALEVLRDIAEGGESASARVAAVTQAARMLGWNEPDRLSMAPADPLTALLAKARGAA